MLTVSDMIALLKQDKLRPEQITVITHNTGNRQLRELIIRLEEKDLAKHVEIFNSGLIIKATVLPKEMVAFVNLKTLALQGHRSLCALPAWIGQLSNLEELTLYYNKNITSIPPEIGQLKKLRTLSITSCALTALPAEIGQLPSLEHLNLHSNNLPILPPEIGNLHNLKTLEVRDNPLLSLPEEIGKLKNLIKLDFNLSTRFLIPTTFLLMKKCLVCSYTYKAPFYAFKAKELRKAAAKYAVASMVMAQGARTMPDSAAQTVFSMPELRSHIASFVGWHPSFNSGQLNAGFADRFEAQQQKRTSISEYDFLTKIIQRPKL